MRKNSPTSLNDRQRPKKRPEIPCRREPPEIEVKITTGSTYSGWQRVKAQLRNKRGYIYLCWRDGKTVRTFYLGKAPRSCPTTAAPAPPAVSSGPGSPRRAKNSPKNRLTLSKERTEGTGPTRSTPKK